MLLLLACSGVIHVGKDATTPEVTLDGPLALDPWRSGTLEFPVTVSAGTADAAFRAVVVDGSGAERLVLAEGAPPASLPWDGRGADGAVLLPGTYTILATFDGAEATHPVEIVDLGLASGTLGGERIALCWHNAGGPGRYYEAPVTDPSFQLGSTHDDVAAIAIPAVWSDLSVPPDDAVGQNLPAAYAWDAHPTFTVTLASPPETALVPHIEGWTLVDAASEDEGGSYTFTMDAALATGPSVVEPTLDLVWSTREGDVLHAVAHEAIPLRMYALMGPPVFDEIGAPYLPWVAVVDPLLRNIAGVSPEPNAVLAAVVDYIYEDLGLSYDTRSGSSAYVQYDGRGFDGAHLDLTAFLGRRNGSVINCTDCAALVEALGEMLGVDAQYAIIDPDFTLNQILAIGGDDFSNCPFGAGGCGFNYHAVATSDWGETIFDATLRLDGDDDPGSLPSVALPVHAIPGEEYLERLVMRGRPGYGDIQKGTLQ